MLDKLPPHIKTVPMGRLRKDPVRDEAIRKFIQTIEGAHKRAAFSKLVFK